jgi:hypothetical protein
MPSPALSPADAVRIAQRARRLVRSGRLSHTAYVVLDNLLWSCRPKNASHAVVSYNGLARLAHLAKATITRAIVTLEALRLITKVRTAGLIPLGVWRSAGQEFGQQIAFALYYGLPSELMGGRHEQDIFGRPVFAANQRRGAAAGGVRTLPSPATHLCRGYLMRLLPLLLTLLLGGCLSLSSSNPPPPSHTTVVVPPGSTAVCPNGTAPPC